LVEPPSTRGSGGRCDINIAPGPNDDRLTEIDVVRVNPSCKSYANGGHVHARGAAWVVGYSAGEKEAQKTKKHGPRLEEKGITFVPFGVETYGALAKGASKTITNLAECIWNREPEAHSLSNTKRNIQAGVRVSEYPKGQRVGAAAVRENEPTWNARSFLAGGSPTRGRRRGKAC
jgi:hypothetical protein